MKPNRIWLSGEIVAANTRDFAADFERAEKRPGPIEIWLNTPGGDVAGADAIVDIMRAATKDVITVGAGSVMSAGVNILAAGTPGLRFALPKTVVMIHQLSGGVIDNAAEMRATGTHIDEYQRAWFADLSAMCGKKKTYWLDAIAKSGGSAIYMTAEDARQEGIVDHVGKPNVAWSYEVAF